MRTTKRFINFFRFYDGVGLARYLEKQAEKGWMLGVDPAEPWKFHRVEPQKLHCAVVFLPKPGDRDPDIQARDREFLEFCAHDGWEFACGDEYKRVFYNTRPDPTPIYSDPAMELENIQRSGKKYLGTILRGPLFLGFVYLIRLCLDINSNFVKTVSNPEILILMVGILSLLFPLTEYVSYQRWLRMVKKAISQGETIEAVPCRKFLWVSLVGCVLLLSLFLFNSISILFYVCIIITVCLIPVLPILYVQNVTSVQHNKPKTGFLRIVGMVAVMLLPILALTILGFVSTETQLELNLNSSVNNSVIGNALGWEDLAQPLYLEDFMPAAEPESDPKWSNQASFFLERHTMKQTITVAEESVDIHYTVVKVRMESLYELCRADLLEFSDNGFPSYVPVDAAVWGANEAYLLMDGDRSWNVYLLCYDGILVEFRPGCELTEEQMRICGEKFLSCVE